MEAPLEDRLSVQSADIEMKRFEESSAVYRYFDEIDEAVITFQYSKTGILSLAFVDTISISE